jgi:hypothetical protein
MEKWRNYNEKNSPNFRPYAPNMSGLKHTYAPTSQQPSPHHNASQPIALTAKTSLPEG